jgi:hypothetical protein
MVHQARQDLSDGQPQAHASRLAPEFKIQA